MKNILLLIALATLFISCNDTTKNEQVVNETIKTEGPTEKDKPIQENSTSAKSWMDEISLNNGSKWEANPETTKGIKNMIRNINQTKPETVVEFQELGTKLNDEKNDIIKKCTMKGPSHDNLHIFLYPLINKIKDLMTVNSVTEGSKITTNIQAHLEGYNLYFH